ncbi:MAG: DUF3305 domain-containing protein [Thalassobaculales bacterium]
MTRYSESLPVGIVVERRRLDHPWADAAWRPVEVMPGAPALDGPWPVLAEGPGFTRWYAGTLDLLAHRRDTASIRDNLMWEKPQLWVVLRQTGEGEGGQPWQPILVTAAPDEAQHCMEAGEDLVEAVDMPEAVAIWLADFVRRMHVEVPVYKRQRVPAKGGPADPGLPVGAPDRRGRR